MSRPRGRSPTSSSLKKIPILIVCLAVGAVALRTSPAPTRALSRDSGPVYLEDPGLGGLAVRPDYISFPTSGPTFVWIRSMA
jgi:hypothetical protein